MTKKISIATSALLLSSSTLFADSASIKEAFKNGSVSGDISVYTKTTDEDGIPKEGFTAGTVGINYETDTFNGFKVIAGFRAGHEFDEQEENDYEEDFSEDSVMHTAAISYANDDFFVTVGRQEIDLTWMGDYNESIVAGITVIPDTTLILGYAHRQAVAAEDEISDFNEIVVGNDYILDDGAYVVELINTSIQNVELAPYYYNVPDAVDFYGLKTSYSNDLFSIMAHYASSSVDSKLTTAEGVEDGNVLHIEAGTQLAGINLTAGYITTDKDGGLGAMDAFGENIDPTEELDDVILEEADSTTLYGSIGYEIAGVELSALYADVEYGASKLDANELSLMVGYNFTDELSVGATYSDVEKDNTDSDAISAVLTYAF